MKKYEKIVLIILYIVCGMYIASRLLSELSRIAPFYYNGSFSYFKATFDFNIFDTEISSMILKQCIAISVVGLVIGFLNLTRKQRILHITTIILIVKLIPALFRHGVFDLQTVLILIITCFISSEVISYIKLRIMTKLEKDK